MKVNFLPTYSKYVEQDISPVKFHYYHIDIYSDENKSFKMYKLIQNGVNIKLDFKHELNTRDFPANAKYHLISLENDHVTAYYK
jgi:hypothetical protein